MRIHCHETVQLHSVQNSKSTGRGRTRKLSVIDFCVSQRFSAVSDFAAATAAFDGEILPTAGVSVHVKTSRSKERERYGNACFW